MCLSFVTQNVDYNTFPLGDSRGTQISSGCGYPDLPSPRADQVYQGHFAVGVNTAARNEWLCSIDSLTGIDLSLPGPSIVHGIAFTGADIPSLKTTRASIVWSPRSDIMLYGMTAPVTLLAGQGINLALGTDWVATGSMNMLREFSCALEHNKNGLSDYFSDKDLLKMATSGAALAAGIENFAGKLASGYIADLTLFDASVRSDYAAAVNARQEDIVLVLKAGSPLYGDGPVVDALSQQPGDCELMGATVAGDCMADQRLCVATETIYSYAELFAAADGLHPLYSCGGAPEDEPTCTPARNEGDGIVFSGIPTASDTDGDGVANDTDNCPTIFNPPRPVDNYEQGDGDEDGIGDVCDDVL